ncbi:flavodoxin family protein [candidate division WOR-3 bacterium]|nr:flavodoxin family protein [candidate division WOR-3 bacterium]
MENKKMIIICESVHHDNTLKIARAIGEVLEAEIIKPRDFNESTIPDYDFIGFGSGIYGGAHHKNLLDLAEKFETQNGKKAFIFSTSMIRMSVMHKALRDKLLKKGFDIIGEFHCKGFTDYSILKYFFGGVNKGRPNKKDLQKAQTFAKKLKEQI